MTKVGVNHKDMQNSDVKDMLEAAVHFGHKTQKWNPKMRKFIYGSKNGIHIFDLYKTKDALEKATSYLNQAAKTGKKVLLVGTKPQAGKIIESIGEKSGMPYVSNKWMGGLLTNFSTMKQRIKYYQKLKKEEQEGEFSKYTKKEGAFLKKTIAKLEEALGGVRNMDNLPDIVFVADSVRDRIAIKEANKLKIPVVAIVDSNSDPSGVLHPIPGNDDAIKSIQYLLSKIETSLLNKPVK
jgi:small subunit ribosomal protein S2